jgi:hypothetical protein
LDEGLRLVREFEGSGQSREAFCLERGLSVGTLDYWRRRAGSCGEGRLLEVEVRPDGNEAESRGLMSIEWPCGVKVSVPVGKASGRLLREWHEVFQGAAACSR